MVDRKIVDICYSKKKNFLKISETALEREDFTANENHN